jgi:N-methylhydantoinase B
VTSRLAVAPEGIFGGGPGAAGRFSVNGEPVTTQARVTLAPGDVVRLELPGGGGYGSADAADAATRADAATGAGDAAAGSRS